MAERMIEDRIIPQNTGTGRPARPSRPGNVLVVGPSGGADESVRAHETEFRRAGGTGMNRPSGGDPRSK
jgi:hypothetical protein